MRLCRRAAPGRIFPVVRDALHPIPDEYPEPPHLGGPAGFELLRWDGEALRPVEHVPLPHPDVRTLPHALLAADLDGDGAAEELRRCAAGEGEHFTLWRRDRRTGERRRVAHEYFDWGVLVEPSCAAGEDGR